MHICILCSGRHAINPRIFQSVSVCVYNLDWTIYTFDPCSHLILDSYHTSSNLLELQQTPSYIEVFMQMFQPPGMSSMNQALDKHHVDLLLSIFTINSMIFFLTSCELWRLFEVLTTDWCRNCGNYLLDILATRLTFTYTYRARESWCICKLIQFEGEKRSELHYIL